MRWKIHKQMKVRPGKVYFKHDYSWKNWIIRMDALHGWRVLDAKTGRQFASFEKLKVAKQFVNAIELRVIVL